jgi:hypothetical protein
MALLVKALLAFVSLAALFNIVSSNTSWWSLGVSSISNGEVDVTPCNALQNELQTPEQQAFCNYNGKVINNIAIGIRSGIVKCQEKFSDWRWNCSAFSGEFLFGRFINNFTRETAVLEAILAAFSASKLAELCREEKIDNCTCKAEGSSGIVDGTFITYSCSSDPDTAETMLLDFWGEAKNIPNDTANLVNNIRKRNHLVGTNLVKQKNKKCRCHGFSGGCNVQTCYYKSQDGDTIAGILRERYSSSVEVHFDTATNQITPVISQISYNVTRDLTHVSTSPDLCNSNPELGVLGTSGRPCNGTVSANDYCGIMCCGRGHYTVTKTIYEECCEFVYCCRVECKPCPEPIVTHEHYCH